MDSKPNRAESGFGAYELPTVPCLTDAERASIRSQLYTSRLRLFDEGVLKIQPQVTVFFQWPLVAVGSAAEGYGYHGISGFVDQDPRFPNSLLDYKCGTRTYDLALGYNHKGVDFFTWPYSWTWMDNDEVQIVAMAPGTILLKSDGNHDESCGFGTGTWNAVYVQHKDGSVAWYGHMKRHSLTTKVVGQRVAAGEYLGVVGSSGNSSGPHLHLELYDVGGNLVEPFAGPCNGMSARSWWISQKPYYDCAVNRLLIGDAPPQFQPCPRRLITNEAASLERGALGYFTVFYRDQLAGQVGRCRLLEPDGSTYRTWTQVSSVPHYAASYWWRSQWIGGGAPTGTWTFQVDYQGQTYSRTFTVN